MQERFKCFSVKILDYYITTVHLLMCNKLSVSKMHGTKIKINKILLCWTETNKFIVVFHPFFTHNFTQSFLSELFFLVGREVASLGNRFPTFKTRCIMRLETAEDNCQVTQLRIARTRNTSTTPMQKSKPRTYFGFLSSVIYSPTDYVNYKNNNIYWQTCNLYRSSA